MAFRQGFIQHLDYGTSPTASATVGKVVSGTMAYDSAGGFAMSIGGVADVQDGMVNATGSATFMPTNATFLANALRTSPTSSDLTELVFLGGTSSEAYSHDDAKINTLRLSCSVGQLLQAEVAWIAKAPSQVAVPTWKAYDTGSPFAWHQGTTVTLEGGSYQLREFSIEVNNNCTAETSLDTKSANSQRLPEEVLEGNEEVSGSFTTAVPISSSIMDDIYGDTRSFTNTAALVFTNGTGALTITVDNMACRTHKMPFQPAGEIILFETTFHCKMNDASAIAISYA